MCTIASIFFNIQLGFAEDNDITEFYNNQTYGILFDNGTYLNEDTILTEEESKKLVDDINNGSIRYKTPREESKRQGDRAVVPQDNRIALYLMSEIE